MLGARRRPQDRYQPCLTRECACSVLLLRVAALCRSVSALVAQSENAGFQEAACSIAGTDLHSLRDVIHVRPLKPPLWSVLTYTMLMKRDMTKQCLAMTVKCYQLTRCCLLSNQ